MRHTKSASDAQRCIAKSSEPAFNGPCSPASSCIVHSPRCLSDNRRYALFLDIPPNEIGVIHGGKKKPTGIIDIALMQSLVRQGVVSDVVADYGHVVVDESHHPSAVGFEAIARQAKARYVLGLSATVT